jgi:hypothetical protein
MLLDPHHISTSPTLIFFFFFRADCVGAFRRFRFGDVGGCELSFDGSPVGGSDKAGDPVHKAGRRFDTGPRVRAQ